MSEEFSFKDWASQGIEGVRSKIHLPKTGVLPVELLDKQLWRLRQFEAAHDLIALANHALQWRPDCTTRDCRIPEAESLRPNP